MSRRRGIWIYGCPFVVWALGLAFVFVNPIIGAMVVSIAILTILIIYVYRKDTDEEPSSSIRERSDVQEPVYRGFMEPEEDAPIWELAPSTFQTLEESEVSESTKDLQQRIEELERRVQSLKEELARDPASFAAANLESADISKGDGENEESELSEKAIQQLIEALEEKLAKGAISKQLYTRLRDKYIARRKKAKGKRKASSKKRGTKDSSTGDK
jgi:hypothetical protein